MNDWPRMHIMLINDIQGLCLKSTSLRINIKGSHDHPKRETIHTQFSRIRSLLALTDEVKAELQRSHTGGRIKYYSMQKHN